MLNSMADKDFLKSLQVHQKWGLRFLDLKDCIFEKSVLDLDDDEAYRAANLIHEHGLQVYCLSTPLFYDEVEKGEAAFLPHLNRVARAVEIANILQPSVIRLLAPRSSEKSTIHHSVDYLRDDCSWLFPLYREAIDQICDAGFQVTIENEVHGCLMSNPEEIIGFFDCLSRDDNVFFTYDVQNLWQMGTYPSSEVVARLAPLTRYLHLKGGMSLPDQSELYWASSLADASWDVATVMRDILSTGSCEVICLNPSHGKRKPDYNYADITRRDFEYVQACIQKLGF